MRFLLTFVVCLVAASAVAQTAPAPAPQTTPAPQRTLLDLLNSGQWRLEQISANHWRMTGDVQWDPAEGLTFSADEIEVFTDTNTIAASGNVVFTNPEGRIAAERIEFDWNTGRATFHQASGIMSLGATVDRAQFGNQDPDVYFYGDTIEKLSARQYKITRGGFTTCVQPTPRWEVTSGSVTINLDEYAIARNMVLRVKGVPLIFLPVIYYPIQDDERATGILMPTYGASTLRGQSLSNAFFWAIGRSQDATLFHDWFTRTGQGMGAEYRYQSSASSYGNMRLYRLAQNETQYTENGVVTTLPENTSFQVQGSMVQTLGDTVRARGRVDYFSSITTQQLYQQNMYYATSASRVIDGGISAGVGWLSASAQYLRHEIFGSSTRSTVYGSTPRVTAIVAPQRLPGLPFYGSVNSDFAYLPYRNLINGVITVDNSLGRVNLAPALRAPLSRLTYLSVVQTATSQTTYYTRSLDASGRMGSDSLVRQMMSLRTDVIGPVFTKIWDTPTSTSTERMKHVIEPVFALDYVTEIDNQAQVPRLSDVSDFIVGGAAKFIYGLNNRFFYRGRPVNGAPGTTREFVTVGVQQTFYTDPLSSRYDTTYVSATGRPNLVDLSPVALTVRMSPNALADASARLEYDVTGNGLQILTTGSTLQLIPPAPAGLPARPSLSANVAYSRYRYSPAQPTNSYLTASTTSRWLEGRVGGTYAVSWDIARGYIQGQSMMASYMAQCCGLQADFQFYNLPPGSPIPSDRRFNFSFVLAGLGTFSNFFGAFGQR
ncbi:MAG TPA: putative LPS assembly protein LptD [Vicinamibacterales bacterium]